MVERAISFRFDAKKAAQAANWLLRRSGGRRNYMELVKLLYLADRRALLSLESQITGDKLVSLPYGPVLSRILNLIRFGPITEEDGPWFDAVSAPCGYDVTALGDSGESELSGAEVQILNEVYTEYGSLDWKQLSRLTHELPEWSEPDGASIPITPEQILSLGGKTPEQVDGIRKELALFEQLDRELAAFESVECVSSR